MDSTEDFVAKLISCVEQNTTNEKHTKYRWDDKSVAQRWKERIKPIIYEERKKLCNVNVRSLLRCYLLMSKKTLVIQATLSGNHSKTTKQSYLLLISEKGDSKTACNKGKLKMQLIKSTFLQTMLIMPFK
jgi:hypothetical protein